MKADLGTALISGLVGALIAAFLSYMVRLRAKRQEDLEERKRLARVNFLLLTNAVAADQLMKNFVENMLKLANVKEEEGYGYSHAVVSLLASKIAEMEPEELEHVRLLARPFITSSVAAMDKFDVSQSDLGHMTETTIYTYHRYKTAAARLQTALEMLDGLIEKGNPKLLDAGVLHGAFTAYQSYADACGLLRAAFASSAEISSAYSYNCLVRSFKAAQSEVAASMAHSSKLELAKKALAAQADAVVSGVAKEGVVAATDTPTAS